MTYKKMKRFDSFQQQKNQNLTRKRLDNEADNESLFDVKMRKKYEPPNSNYYKMKLLNRERQRASSQQNNVERRNGLWNESMHKIDQPRPKYEKPEQQKSVSMYRDIHRNPNSINLYRHQQKRQPTPSNNHSFHTGNRFTAGLQPPHPQNQSLMRQNKIHSVTHNRKNLFSVSVLPVGNRNSPIPL